MNKQMKDRLLTRAEVAERFGISKRFLETCAMKGQGPRRIYLGRLVRYRAADVAAWIEANSTGGQA
jgi:predicted DNA-binding transcriptional regulator AlpA